MSYCSRQRCVHIALAAYLFPRVGCSIIRLLEMSGFGSLLRDDRVSISSACTVEIVEMLTAYRGELSPV
jgi:hypothetical protein